MSDLIPALESPTGRPALSVGGLEVTYEQLAGAAGALVERIEGTDRIAIWAESTLATCVAVVGALEAGATVIPINPKIGGRELDHIRSDSEPDVLVAPDEAAVPRALGGLERMEVDLEAKGCLPGGNAPAAPAFILYTSGTTGLPKGVVVPRSAVAFDLDALAQVWEWTPEDMVVHGLPLFHVHGLILGVVGPLRVGGSLRHIGRFSPEGLSAGLEAGGTMTFGVPTMYSRLADAIGEDRRLAEPFRRARMVISGSAALPTPVFERIRAATGQPIAERYGLTETMMNCAIRCWGDRRPGYVGPPLPGIDLRLVDDEGVEVTERDDETIGEIHVRGPNLFDGYLNRPDATDEAMSDGWFRTGDLATVSADGYVRIVGRRQTDLIKTGGYKVGAGEVENALLEHPAVAEVAVVGEPDDDLGQRIVAYVVPREGRPGASELVDHVAALLAPHKRPRDVRLVDSLPRNDMGKVRKTELTGPAGTDRRPSS